MLLSIAGSILLALAGNLAQALPGPPTKASYTPYTSALAAPDSSIALPSTSSPNHLTPRNAAPAASNALDVLSAALATFPHPKPAPPAPTLTKPRGLLTTIILAHPHPTKRAAAAELVPGAHPQVFPKPKTTKAPKHHSSAVPEGYVNMCECPEGSFNCNKCSLVTSS